jgi:hypothetical protein
MSEHQTRQVNYGCANDGVLYEEAPDLGPLQEGAEAAELAKALSGLTASSGSPSSARDPSVRSLVDRPGADRERVHAPPLRPAPPALPARRSVPAARRCRPCPGEQDGSGRVLDHDLLSLGWCRWHEYHCPQEVMNGARSCGWWAGFPAGAVRLSACSRPDAVRPRISSCHLDAYHQRGFHHHGQPPRRVPRVAPVSVTRLRD